MTALIVQCRLSSTRLPQKALLPLGDSNVISCVLRNLKRVNAQKFILACDYESKIQLAQFAEQEGFEIFAGEKDDVLARFCACIECFRLENETIVRATADNPFLFCDSINLLLDEFARNHCDYLTFRNLPHGAGAEVFSAASLLRARSLTNSPYDHEHVCPALYNHAENFRSIVLDAPKSLSRADLRITIDTEADYRAAKKIFANLVAKHRIFPFDSADVIQAASEVREQILFVPLTEKGRGTGHLCRCVDLARETGGIVYLSREAQENPIFKPILKNLADWQISSEIPAKDEFPLIVTDLLCADEKFSFDLAEKSPVFAIEDSTEKADFADYLADFLPPLSDNRIVNLSDASYLKQAKKRLNPPSKLKKVLVSFGGEDPMNLSEKTAEIFFALGFDVTAICRNPLKNKKIRHFERVENLREVLHKYDLVVTHYGLSAFEAESAGCAVILTCPSELHAKLAEKCGFAFVSNPISKEKFEAALQNEKIYVKFDRTQKNLSDLIKKISHFKRKFCPNCGEKTFSAKNDKIVRREIGATWRKCATCGCEFESFSEKCR